MKYRKIMCLEPVEGRTFRASNVTTGEIMESGDMALLLKRIAADPFAVWRWEAVIDAKLVQEASIP